MMVLRGEGTTQNLNANGSSEKRKQSNHINLYKSKIKLLLPYRYFLPEVGARIKTVQLSTVFKKYCCCSHSYHLEIQHTLQLIKPSSQIITPHPKKEKKNHQPKPTTLNIHSRITDFSLSARLLSGTVKMATPSNHITVHARTLKC